MKRQGPTHSSSDILVHRGQPVFQWPSKVNELKAALEAQRQKNQKLAQFLKVLNTGNRKDNQVHNVRNQLQSGLKKLQKISMSKNLHKAVYCEQQHFYEKTIKYYKKALVEQKKVYGIESQEVAATLNNIGLAYSHLSCFDAAMDYYQRAMTLFKKINKGVSQDSAIMLDNMGKIYHAKHQFSEAFDYLQQALDVQLKINGEYHDKTADKLNNLANLYKDCSEFDKALLHYQRAQAIYRYLHGHGSDGEARVLHNIGKLYSDQSAFALALKYYEQVLTIVQKQPRRGDPLVAALFVNRGNVYMRCSQLTKATEDYKKALPMLQTIYGKDNLKVVNLYNNFANIALIQSRFTEALAYYSRIIDIYRQVYGTENGHIAIVLNAIGAVYHKQGLFSTALFYYEQALTMKQYVYGKRHVEVAASYTNLGALYSEQENYDKALENYEEAFAIFKHCNMETSQEAVSVWNGIGIVYYQQSLFSRAIDCFQEALKCENEFSKEDTQEKANALHNIGIVYDVSLDFKKALHYYEQALSMRQTLFGQNSVHVAETMHNLGALYHEHNALLEALNYFEKASNIFETSLGKFHSQTVLTQTRLATVATDYAKQQSFEKNTDVAESYFLKVETIYQSILTRNKKALALYEQENNLTPYTWISHHRTLHALSTRYRERGHYALSAQLYTEEANACKILFPIWAKHYLREAIRDYQHGHQDNELYCAKLWYQLAQLEQASGHWDHAIHTLARAMNAHNVCDWENTLLHWQEAREQQIEQWSLDCYVQYQDCLTRYEALQWQLLSDIMGNEQPIEKTQGSEQSHQQAIALTIQVRNLLDQAFSGFVKECVVRYHQEDERLFDDYYFPIANSKERYEVKLRGMGLLPPEAMYLHKKDLRIKSLVGISKKVILDCLVQAGYLNDAKKPQPNVIAMDPNFNKLDRRFSLCFDILKTLFETSDPKKPIGRKSKAIDEIFAVLTSKPPEPVLLMQLLVEAGFARFESTLEDDVDNAAISPEKDCIAMHASLQPMSPGFRHALLEAAEKIAPLQATHVARWFLSIQELLVTKITQKQRIQERCYLSDYPDSYHAFIQQQDFYYYDANNNQVTPGLWQQAWLQVLSDLNNTSKHIRLVPHVMTHDLSEKVAGLQYVSVNMHLHYTSLEGRLDPWSFFAILPRGENGFDDVSALSISKLIGDTLKAHGYFDEKSHIIHPLALAIFDAKNAASPSMTTKQEQDFLKQLEKDLPAVAKPFAWDIMHSLIRHGLRETNHLFLPERLVDIDNLFNHALKDVLTLLKQLALDREKTFKLPLAKVSFDGLNPVVGQTRFKNEIQDLHHPVQLSQEQWRLWLCALQHKPELFTKAHCLDFHHWLKETISLHQKQPEVVNELVDILRQAAEVMEKPLPWLALHYYSLTRRILQQNDAHQKQHWVVYEAFALLCQRLLLHRKAIECYWQTRQVARRFARQGQVTADEQKRYQTLHQEAVTIRAQQWNHVDEAFSKQWEYAYEQYLDIQYLSFKLAVMPTSHYHQQQLRVNVGALLIKLRSLLDQGFSHFVNLMLNRVNGKPYQHVAFPCASSESEFQSILQQAGLLEGKSNLQECLGLYTAIMACQPYTYHQLGYGKTSWLEKLRDLSNRAKHESVLQLKSSQCNEEQSETMFSYAVHYLPSRCYPWHFYAILGNDWQRCVRLIEIFIKAKLLTSDQRKPYGLLRELAIARVKNTDIGIKVAKEKVHVRLTPYLLTDYTPEEIIQISELLCGWGANFLSSEKTRGEWIDISEWLYQSLMQINALLQHLSDAIPAPLRQQYSQEQYKVQQHVKQLPEIYFPKALTQGSTDLFTREGLLFSQNKTQDKSAVWGEVGSSLSITPFWKQNKEKIPVQTKNEQIATCNRSTSSNVIHPKMNDSALNHENHCHP